MNIRIIVIFVLLHFAQSKILDLSCSQIQEFVDGHNSRRQKLAKGEISDQPAAAEMKYIIWDKGLAKKASLWASNNNFLHNPDKNDISGRFITGENIFRIASTNLKFKLNIDTALSSWFNEHKDYQYGPIKYSDFTNSKNPIGHYTQMSWSNSTYIGCGVSEYVKDSLKMYFIVCNYGPTGNYIGETPYKAGRGSGELKCGLNSCQNLYGNTC